MRIPKNYVRPAFSNAKSNSTGRASASAITNVNGNGNAKKDSSFSVNPSSEMGLRYFRNVKLCTNHSLVLRDPPHIPHCIEDGTRPEFQRSLLQLLVHEKVQKICHHHDGKFLNLLSGWASLLVLKDLQRISRHGARHILSAIWDSLPSPFTSNTEGSFSMGKRMSESFSIWKKVTESRRQVFCCRHVSGQNSISEFSKRATLEKILLQHMPWRERGRCKSMNLRSSSVILDFTSRLYLSRLYSSDATNYNGRKPAALDIQDDSQRAVTIALWCNFLVFCLKCGVWVVTGSHVMLAESVHSLADIANQALLAYGLVSSKRAPDELHPYGYSKERFVWSLISAVGIFCLGSGATIFYGFSNLWRAELPENMSIAAMVLAGSMIIESVSLVVAFKAVKNCASAEGMSLWDYCWRGHDPTAVAVMMEDGAAVAGLIIASMSLIAVSLTGNPVYDPIGSIFVGNLLGMVAVFLIQRNRHALLGRAMDNQDMKLVLDFLASDPVVDAVYDCKSEVIGPRSYRFKAEIDFNGIVVVQNYLKTAGQDAWATEFRQAVKGNDEIALDKALSKYGEEVVLALGSEVDRLEKEIQRLVPGIRYVDIETHNPNGPLP